MKKVYSTCIRVFSIISVLLFWQIGASQTTVQIGTGGDTSQISGYSPINRASGTTTLTYSRANFVILASELGALNVPIGATISSLSFYKGVNGTSGNTGQFAIWMKNSTVTPPLSTSTTWASIIDPSTGHTQVYNNPTQSLPHGAGTEGWIEFSLMTPFQWTGNNIEIATDWYGMSPSNTTPGTIRWQTDINYANYIVGGLANSAPATLSATAAAYKRRPNTQITYTAPACTAPFAGTATSSAASVCANSNFVLSLTNHTSGTGSTFQWQRSSDNNNWTNIADGTSWALTVNQASDFYYRAIVTCGSQSDTTDNTLLVNTTLPLNGLTYTIKSSTATGGTNFQTFADLAARLNCAGVSGPVTVTVEPGTYNGRFVLNAIQGVNPFNQVTINGGGQTLTNNTTVSADRAAIVLNGAQYVTINNLNIDVAKGTYGWGIQLMNAADNNSITNCTIHSDSTATATNTQFAGIVASGSLTTLTTAGNNANYTTITGNLIRGGQHGIIMIGNGTNELSRSNIISNNIIRNMVETGIYLEDHDGAQVTGNNISRPLRNVNVFFRGVYITGTTTRNVLVKNNIIHDSHTGYSTTTGDAYCIYLSGADAPAGEENKVINNLIYAIGGQGSQYGIYNSGSDGMYAYHNTIILDDQTATAGNARGLYQTTAATNIIFKNNISYVTRTGSGVKVAIFFSTTTSTITSNNNVLYVTPATANYHIGSFGSTAASLKTTLADWKTVNSNAYDQNSAAANPNFSSGYKPTNSQVDGVTMLTTFITGIDRDIYNIVRDANHPDAGAIEWSSVADDAAVTGFVAPTPAPYCASSLPVVFTITNAGTAVLNSATINWTVNGNAQPVQNPAALNLAPGASTNITLGTIPVAVNTLYDFSATVSNPNGVADGNNANNSYTLLKWRTALNGSYTVNKTTASSATTFSSIKGLMDTLKILGVCGPVTINVDAGSGPYTEKVTIDSIPGMSSTNMIVLNGNGNTLQYNPTLTTNRSDYSTILLRGIKYLTINNLVVAGSNANGACGINIINGASNITINNCTINIPLAATSGSTGTAITTAGNSNYLLGTLPVSSNITISNNSLNGGGVFLVGDFAVTSRHSNFSLLNNTITNPAGDFITLLGVEGVAVQGNDLSFSSRLPGSTLYCIYVWGGVNNMLINKNRIHDIPGTSGIYAGIYLSGGTYPVTGMVSNNIMYNWTNTGYQRGIYNNSADSLDIYHNTIVLDDASYSGNQSTHAYYWALSSITNFKQRLKNNIFYINRGGSGTKVLVEVSSLDNLGKSNPDYNVYAFGSSGTTGAQFGRSAGVNYSSFAAWQALAIETHGVNADPQFASSTSFVPTNPLIDGAAMNTAQVGGITEDIAGITRSATPDAGAHEFTPALPVTISEFRGEKNGDINNLFWKTASETNNAGFELQRSTDGINFGKLTYVTSKAANGNSNIVLSYNVNDLKPLGGNGYYRLKQIDKDGRYKYSDVILLSRKVSALSLSAVYPSPVKNELNIVISSPKNQKTSLAISDIAGKTLFSKEIQLSGGDNKQIIDVALLAPGTYFISVSGIGNSIINTIKFIKY